MTRETFLLLFVVGAATLATWIMLCLPRLAPRSIRASAVHVCVALLVSFALAPAADGRRSARPPPLASSAQRDPGQDLADDPLGDERRDVRRAGRGRDHLDDLGAH